MSTAPHRPGAGLTRWAIAAFGVLLVVVAGIAWRAWSESDRNADVSRTRPMHVLVSGDTAGWITPCGCTSNQSGGLLRRGTYVNEACAQSELIVADVGGAPGGTSEYQRVKFEAMLRGERAMGLAAHNIGGPEAALGAEYLRDVAKRLEVPFVSANARDDAGVPIASPLEIVETAGRRVALVGVLSPKLAAAGIQVTDPREAVLAVIRAAAGRYDSLIVLAYLPEDELREFATGLPEADAVIGGPTGQSIQPQMIGPTLLASATNKGKFLVHLQAPAQNSRDRWSGRIVEMGPSLVDDSKQVENLHRFHEELAGRDFAASETGLVAALLASMPADYAVAGTQSCRACHAKDCKMWDESGHGQAWQTLRDGGQHVDPLCQHCHTTGYGMPGGFVSALRSAERTGVGCETCHGPSLAHQKRPTTKTPFAAADQCVRCHDHENSPTFEYAPYWDLIRHGAAASAGAGN